MFNDSDLQAAAINWLASEAPAIAATLTFRDYASGRRLTQAQAQEAVRVYLRRLDRVAYGANAKYRGMKDEVIAVMEGGEGLHNKRIHYHLWLKVPDHMQPEEWLKITSSEWEAIELAGIEKDFQCVVDRGWLNYMLKHRDKPCYIDALDLVNLRVYSQGLSADGLP